MRAYIHDHVLILAFIGFGLWALLNILAMLSVTLPAGLVKVINWVTYILVFVASIFIVFQI